MITVISHVQSTKININVIKTATKYCPKQINGGVNPNKNFMNHGSDNEYIIDSFIMGKIPQGINCSSYKLMTNDYFLKVACSVSLAREYYGRKIEKFKGIFLRIQKSKEDCRVRLRLTGNDNDIRITQYEIRINLPTEGGDELIAIIVEPLRFSQDHIEEICAGQMPEETGRGDGQDRLGDHRFDHQIDQCIQFVLVQLDDTAIALDELGELVFVEIVGPFVRIRPASDDGELQHGVGQVGDSGGDPDRIEVEQCGDFSFGKEHIAGMPVAVNYLAGPGIEAQLADADARFVIE